MAKSQRGIGIAMSYISVAIGLISTLLYTPVMTSIVGEVDYGIYSWALGIIQNLSLFQMGLYATFTRFYSRLQAKRDREGLARLNGLFLCMYLVIAVIAFICGLLLMQISGTLIAWPSEIASHPELINQTRVLMLVMIINICITFPTYIFESNIMVREQFILLRAITILRQICNPLLSLPLLFLGFGNMSLSLATMAVTMATSVIYIVYCFKVLKIRFKFYIPRLADLREIFGFSFFVMINLIVDQINWSLDRILLGSLVSASAVTIYSLADQLSRYFFNFSSTISDVFTPKIHRIVASGSDDWELTRLFTQVARIQFMVLSLIIFGFFGVGEYFSSLYGAASENYHEVYRVTMILFFAVLIPAIQYMAIPILQAKNMHRFKAFANLAIVLSNAICSIPLSLMWGPTGAALGTLIMNVLGNMALNWYYHTRVGLDMRYFWRNMLRIMRGFVLPLCCTLIVHYVIVPDSFVSMILCGLLIVVTYCVSILKWSMNRREQHTVFGFLERIFPSMR